MARIEVFTSDCPLCRGALETIRAAACPKCEVIERPCSGGRLCDDAARYGIKAVPTIVVDGQVVFVGQPSPDEAKRLIPGA